MSFFSFIASDFPLKDVENTKIEFLSIKEAEKRNIPLHDWLENMDIDREKQILMYCEKEEDLDEIAISTYLYDGDIEIKQVTEKKYVSSLSWRYTDERALQLIDYIKKHLEVAEDIEFWNIWIGNGDADKPCEITKCHVDSLEKSHLKYMSECYDRAFIVKR